MKLKFFLRNHWLLSLLLCNTVHAQPDYVFKNPTLLTAPGSEVQVGGKYLFRNVKPTGSADAIVTISYMSPSAHLQNFDYFGGYDEAFEVKVAIDPFTNGYVEFDIQFIERLPLSGPIDLSTIIPKVQPVVTAAAIDIDGQDDGGLPLYEYDELNLNVDHPGQVVNYLLTGTDITVSTSGDWIKGLSTKADPKPGIDITAFSAMFVVKNYTISSLKYRVGAENNTPGTMVRLKSLYFKDLLATVLPVGIQLNGRMVSNQVQLNWTINNSSDIDKIIIERNSSGKGFMDIATYQPNTNNGFPSYQETIEGNGSYCLYRLRIELRNGKKEWSNVVRLTQNEKDMDKLSVFPNPVNYASTISIFSHKAQTATLLIYDASGQPVVKNIKVELVKGQNQFGVTELLNLPSGSYTIALIANDNCWTSKVIKQ